MNRTVRSIPALLVVPAVAWIGYIGHEPRGTIEAAEAAPASPTTFIAPGGVKITPLEVETDDVSSMLDIAMWKFRVVRPATKQSLSFELELREKGKRPKVLCYFSSWSGNATSEEVVVALRPLQGTLTDSAKIQCYVRRGGATMPFMVKNPLRNLAGQFRSSGPPSSIARDGSLKLMEFSKTGRIPAPGNSLIALTIKTARM